MKTASVRTNIAAESERISMKSPFTRCAIEELTLRVREVNADVKGPLRITAPLPLIEQMVREFRARGMLTERIPSSARLSSTPEV
jgi:hypothetical protein